MPTASFQHIRVTPMVGALGAEVSDVDLTRLSDTVFEEIHRAWLEHQVLFFRDQNIAPGDQVAFARRFGELDTYPFIQPLPDHPEVIPIIKEPDNRFNFGGGWHSDGAYMPEPPKATMLYARDVPETGGDTMFASMYAAWEALSPGMKALLDGLVAVFTANKVHGEDGFYKKADHPMQKIKDQERTANRSEHPVIRFHWRVGSLALWDNRAVQHYALNDYQGQRREMHRITIKGDRPR